LEKVPGIFVRLDQAQDFAKQNLIAGAFMLDKLPAFSGRSLDGVLEDPIDLMPAFRIHVR
jgi:hypothetical protein